MSATYSYDQLKMMRGQAVKDVWHSMIGKPAGIKNTTGLKNGEEIIQAILKGQETPEFLKSFGVRAPKHEEQVETKEMPPKEKKKPGPKPKAKPAVAAPKPPSSQTQTQTQTQAYESTEIPLSPQEVTRIVVRKLIVDDSQYFLDAKTNKLYSVVEERPGALCGTWNPETREADLC
jgi:hypothetical protein